MVPGHTFSGHSGDISGTDSSDVYAKPKISERKQQMSIIRTGREFLLEGYYIINPSTSYTIDAIVANRVSPN